MNQEQVTREVLDAVRPFLGGPHPDDDGWSFAFGEHLESNWGAVYGGALAAGTLAVARAVAPERSPRSLHIQIVRSVPRGAAHATARMRHAGRTVGTVEVDLYDGRDKLAAVALVTMVTPDAVASTHHDTTAEPFQLRATPVDPARWISAPIQDALGIIAVEDGIHVHHHVPNVRPSIDGSMAPGLTITLPWERLEHTGPEASCLVADAMIAAPVIESSLPMEVVGPNADLTLRFTTAPARQQILAAARVLSVQHGTATVQIDIQAGDQQLAHGLATELLLEPR